MSKDNVSKYIILGLLAIKPMSGYDIKSWITNGVGHFWRISYGQIYPILKNFVENDLATFITNKEAGRPEKKVYAITDKGRDIIHKWLQEPLDFQNCNYTSILMIKLYFGSNIGKEAIIQHIKATMEHEQKKLDKLTRVEQQIKENKMKVLDSNDKSYIYRMCTLNQGIIMIKAKIEWCKETIDKLKQE